MARRQTPASYTPLLPFDGLRNSDLLSNHWLEHRLPLEPEWTELRTESDEALARASDLWRNERTRVEQYGSEAPLEHAFIQPLFELLGWKLFYQPVLQNRRPDYALFLNDAAKDAAVAAGRQSAEFWNHPAVLADAKAWHVALDRPTRVGNQREYPPEQIEWYLDRSRLDYAILTNGKGWRLIPRQLAPGKARFQTYLEADIPKLLNAAVLPSNGQGTFEQQTAASETFFRFYLFFSPRAFESRHGRPPLIERALRGSSEYALAVGEDLKERVFDALRLCIEGFLAHEPNGLDASRDLEACREQSFVLLYRLLFIMYAEDRSLLPYRRNDLYTRNRSLARHRDDIAEAIDRIADGRQPDYPPGQVTIWQDLVSLFDLIDRGHARYAVPPYNGGLFDPTRHDFLAAKALPDRFLARVLDQLGRAEDASHPERGLFRVDYRDLAIQHLGSIYEGLLELRPRFAAEPMVVIRERGSTSRAERTVPQRERVPRGWEPTDRRYGNGQVYLETDKGERRASGSYYTPDAIVNYIVENTLGRLCRELSDALDAEIAEAESLRKRARGAGRERLELRLAELAGDFDDRVLRLRVLDPAMGSGHFLVRACQRLAEEIATNPHTSDPADEQLQGDESILTYWKRRVVESCVFGVDLNPMAVELAKLALWLETVSTSEPLTFLDHHLRTGNSLIGARVADLASLPGAMELQQNVFKEQVEQRLPALIDPLIRIREIPSQTPDQIKEKERLYRRSFQPVCDRFRAVADLWCSTFFPSTPRPSGSDPLPSPPGRGAGGEGVPSASAQDGSSGSPGRGAGGEGVASPLTPEQYQRALLALGRNGEFARIAAEPWFQDGLARAQNPRVRAFHWELEFPEVFFDISRQDQDYSFHRGFDAVIGNPPYDVLAEKELTAELPSGRAAEVRAHLAAFKDFIEAHSSYDPSRRGKNNLYKLFICRALGDLLAEGARFGFIVPMALLGDDQAAALRRAILEVGALTSVDAFPQKDDPTRRVFSEAKLSTCVFTMLKTSDGSARQQAFTSRQHPADRIEEASPSLTLRTDQIPLYDPENRAIVSCSQPDWDMAARIMLNGRLARLRDFCTSYQGEVNESIERPNGTISYDPSDGDEVVRGAHICLYALRPASQGTPVYIRREDYLQGKREDSKAFHHRYSRIGFQRKSPQNNFRRLIATLIAPRSFLLESVSYVPETTSKLPLGAVLSVLNSKLAEWYFRLGSSNAMVSEYQFNNLPCPRFAEVRTRADDRLRGSIVAAIDRGQPDAALELLQPAFVSAPFPLVVQDVLVDLVRRIIAIEQARGEIARTQRSALDPAAQPLQNLIDRILYALAGLTPAEAAGLEARLATML